MTPSEIAETLLNGNIAQARHEILRGNTYHAAVTALNVEAELVSLTWDEYGAGDEHGCWDAAHSRVRRCLEGAPNG